MSLVILTEEPSMRTTIEHLLPKLGIDPATVTIIAHQGKTDLKRSIPRKLKAWQTPGTRFLILHDNDRGDCKANKASLTKLVEGAGKQAVSKVRIVCQELEAWFLADIRALRASGYLTAVKPPSFARKDPDTIQYPTKEMQRLRPGYGKGIGSSEISLHLDVENERSVSFRHTIQAIRDLTAA